MNQIYKKIVSTLITFCVIVMLDCSALAGGLKTNFADVEEGSPYYESVQYFADQKVVLGTKDGLFHPKSAMTLDDWTAILNRFCRLTETKTLTYMDLLKEQGTSKDTSTVTLMPGIVYSGIWQAAGIKTYTAYEYGYDSDLDAGTTAMLVTGLIDRESAGQTSISRGKAVRLLYDVAVRKTAAEVPSNLIAFFDVSTDCEDPEETEALLRKLIAAYPDNQLALMLAYDYRFEIWDDLAFLPVRNPQTLRGLDDDGNHIIYLEKDAVSQWALHEIGHAVETCNCSYSKSIALNKAEKKAGIKLFGQYAGVNHNEFIAEASAYFMRNRDNEAALLAMKETMPQTYEHFTKLVSAEPFLHEKYFFNIVSPDTIK